MVLTSVVGVGVGAVVLHVGVHCDSSRGHVSACALGWGEVLVDLRMEAGDNRQHRTPRHMQDYLQSLTPSYALTLCYFPWLTVAYPLLIKCFPAS